ncbi:MAG TPA: hypothetical protein VGG03_09255 [Thermoanaerobaculia bacterium]|jgi:hypothetical protein
MAREPKYGVTLNGWEGLLASLEANAPDFPQLESYRAQLAGMLGQAREAASQQAALAAGKQEATRRLQTLLGDGRKLATLLRNAIRQRYGDKAEKLTEFGLQPFRGRPRPAAEPTAKPPEVQPPATPSPPMPAETEE